MIILIEIIADIVICIIVSLFIISFIYFMFRELKYSKEHIKIKKERNEILKKLLEGKE